MAEAGIYKGKWTSGTGDDTIETFLSIYLFEEDGLTYAACPTLDITGYGNSEQEAKDSLGVMIEEFFDYTTKKNTFRSTKRGVWKRLQFRMVDQNKLT